MVIDTREMEMTNLKTLIAAEKTAWKAKMNTTTQAEYDVAQAAWEKIADEQRAYREKHDLVGVR